MAATIAEELDGGALGSHHSRGSLWWCTWQSPLQRKLMAVHSAVTIARQLLEVPLAPSQKEKAGGMLGAYHSRTNWWCCSTSAPNRRKAMVVAHRVGEEPTRNSVTTTAFGTDTYYASQSSPPAEQGGACTLHVLANSACNCRL